MTDAALLATARALATDAASAEVVAALREKGVDSILLKGPTTAEWLYTHELRGYVDGDVLVDPALVMRAASVLEQLGFEPVDHHVSSHAHPWIRSSDGAQVDLHVSIWGPHVPAERVWRELAASSEVIALGGASVRVLSLPARGLHIVLHAVQHRENSVKAREDLRRAIQRAPVGVWRQAEQLAARLEALSELTDGLMLEPAGWKLLKRLPLARQNARRRHGGSSRWTVRVTRLARAAGPRARRALIAEAVFRRLGRPPQ